MFLMVKGCVMDKIYQGSDILDSKSDTLLQMFIQESLLRNYKKKEICFGLIHST